jgi:alpha-beta hydrolase superfamily lysophospholipase
VTGLLDDGVVTASRPRLVTGDAVELVARQWLVDGTARAAVVLAHGLGAHAGDPTVVATATALHARGFDVVSYDARGHGGSGGASTLGDHEAHDVAAAVELARTRADRVVVVGASMGAIAVLRYASRAPTAGVVVVSCPARWALPRTPKAFAAALMTRTAAGRALAARMMRIRIAAAWTDPPPPVALLDTVDAPIAIVHGAGDTFIPVAAAYDLFDGAREPRSLRVVRDMGHAFSAASTDAVCEAVDWTLGVAG